jgi:hypothetical protein
MTATNTSTSQDYEYGVDDHDDNDDNSDMDWLDLPESHRSAEFGIPIDNENESAVLVRETICV